MVGYLFLILGGVLLFLFARAVFRYIDNCVKMTWFWKIVQQFKSRSVSGDRFALQRIHQRLNSQEKINFLKKRSIKKDYDKARAPFDEYVSFCKSKGLPLSKEDTAIVESIYEMDRRLYPEEAINAEYERACMDYNRAHKNMRAAGETLYKKREQSVELINSVENFVNSIAESTKVFDSDFSDIRLERESYRGKQEFAEKEVKATKAALAASGAGVAVSSAISTMAPQGAMWIATTFGTSSTGTAIAALSGAAQTNAALAWLGGGAVAAGGSGMAAGQALLAMAGPIGWGIAGASTLFGIFYMIRRKKKVKDEMMEETERLKNMTAAAKKIKVQIDSLIQETESLDDSLRDQLKSCEELSGREYRFFTEEQKQSLGALVNNTKSLATLLGKEVS